MSAKMLFGTISSIDPAKGLVRVTFGQDFSNEDNKARVSNWLPVSVPKSLNDKHTFPYDVNEHVWCMMEDEHCENGVVGGAIYSAADMPDGAGADIQRIKWKDGSYLRFNRANGNYELNVKGYINLVSGDGAKVILNDGDNGGIPITSDVVVRINLIEDDSNGLRNVLQSVIGGSPIPEPGSGAPSALQAALAAALTAAGYYTPLDLTQDSDIEDPKATH